MVDIVFISVSEPNNAALFIVNERERINVRRGAYVDVGSGYNSRTVNDVINVIRLVVDRIEIILFGSNTRRIICVLNTNRRRAKVIGN